MAEAKASGEEPSMEEILQSIKKIIAEDDTGKTPEAADKNKVNGTVTHEEVPGSDVLELTEMVEEAPAAPPAAKVEAPTVAAAPAPVSNDVLSKIDEVLAVDKPATTLPAGALLSDQAALAATSAFKKLQTAAEPPIPPLHTTPSPMLASGKTVEEMVLDMLKPMMKDWLDANLPAIVERIVTVEIRKLTK